MVTYDIDMKSLFGVLRSAITTPVRGRGFVLTLKPRDSATYLYRSFFSCDTYYNYCTLTRPIFDSLSTLHIICNYSKVFCERN